MPDLQRATFSDIKHLLPPDCWAVRCNTQNDGEFEQEIVLWHAGPLVLDSLDLDDPAGDGGEDDDRESIFLLFVQGNLTVRGALHNAENDGATGLIVQGDLDCQHALVGGQEIYVTGHLLARTLFWGDYNHGGVIVEGDAQGDLLLATDGYHVDIQGQRGFARQAVEDDDAADNWRLDTPATLAELIDPAFVGDYEGSPYVEREALIAAVLAGQPVVRPQSGAVPILFADRSISPQNMTRVADPAFLFAEEDGAGEHDFEIDELYCRVNLRKADGPDEKSVYLQWGDDTGFCVLIESVNMQETQPGIWQRLTGQAAHATQQTINMGWRELQGDQDTPWHGIDHALDENAPEEVRELIQRGWQTLLEAVENDAHIRQAITPARVDELLALPVSLPYDDFFDDDRLGLWIRNTFCAFCREGDEDEDGEPCTAMLRVTVESGSESGEEIFFYEVLPRADGSKGIKLRFSEDLDDDPADVVSAGQRPLLARAVSVFAAANGNLRRANGALLAGQPPDDEGFALKYWRKNGYLKSRLP